MTCWQGLLVVLWSAWTGGKDLDRARSSHGYLSDLGWATGEISIYSDCRSGRVHLGLIRVNFTTSSTIQFQVQVGLNGGEHISRARNANPGALLFQRRLTRGTLTLFIGVEGCRGSQGGKEGGGGRDGSE